MPGGIDVLPLGIDGRGAARGIGQVQEVVVQAGRAGKCGCAKGMSQGFGGRRRTEM